MNSSDKLASDKLLDAAAADWLIERDEGFAPDRARAFAEWLAQDPRHAEAVSRVGDTLLLFNELRKIRGAYEARFTLPAEHPTDASKHWLARFKPYSWAAGIAAGLVLGATIWWFGATRFAAEEVYTTETPEPRRVALADGSVVDLNENCRVEVRFTAKARNVTLVSGEAHFQVAHDPAKPFIVTARGVALRAVGTAFNVRLTGEAVDVLVTEGKVEVGPAADPKVTGAQPVLVAGERTQIPHDALGAPKIEKTDAGSIQALLAWENRMTNFVDVPLRELVVRMNRCNSTQIVLKDEDLGNRRVGGVIFLNQIDLFISALEREGGFVVERNDAEIILRRAP